MLVIVYNIVLFLVGFYDIFIFLIICIKYDRSLIVTNKFNVFSKKLTNVIILIIVLY